MEKPMKTSDRQFIINTLTTLCCSICLFSITLNNHPNYTVRQSSSSNPKHFFYSKPFQTLPKKDQYFFRIAFGSEHGSRDQRIKKWQKNIRLKIDKNLTIKDKEVIKKVVYELNELLNHSIKIELTTSNQYNSELIITDNKFFKTHIPHSNPNANGYVSVWYNNKNVINKSKILISSQLKNKRKEHVIREELTQSLGILKDSYLYKNSIFYQGHSNKTRFSKEDKNVIKTLYNRDILPGMNREEALHVIL